MTKYLAQKGFTLIEMIVSISIIALISGIFLTNYHSTNKRSELNVSAQELASNIRLAQDHSLGSVKFNDNIPQGGWGVYFNKTVGNNARYIIFANNDDGAYTRDADGSEDFKTVNLPGNVVINSLTVDGAEDEVDLIFLPPDPTIYINGNSNKNLEIGLTDNNSTKTVLINFFGSVDVEN